MSISGSKHGFENPLIRLQFQDLKGTSNLLREQISAESNQAAIIAFSEGIAQIQFARFDV